METHDAQRPGMADVVLSSLSEASSRWLSTTAIWQQAKARRRTSFEGVVRALLELESRGQVQCRRPPRSPARWWRLRVDEGAA